MSERTRTKNHSNNVLEKTKENNELRSVVDVVTNCIKDKVESFSNAEVYTGDEYNPEGDKVIGFRQNVCG